MNTEKSIVMLDIMTNGEWFYEDSTIRIMIFFGFVLFLIGLALAHIFQKVGLEKYRPIKINPEDYQKTIANVEEALTDNPQNDLYDKMCILYHDESRKEFRQWLSPEENDGFLEIYYHKQNPEEIILSEEFEQIISDSTYDGTYVHGFGFRASIFFIMILFFIGSVSLFVFAATANTMEDYYQKYGEQSQYHAEFCSVLY